jgi:hypothetical protein
MFRRLYYDAKRKPDHEILMDYTFVALLNVKKWFLECSFVCMAH